VKRGAKRGGRRKQKDSAAKLAVGVFRGKDETLKGKEGGMLAKKVRRQGATKLKREEMFFGRVAVFDLTRRKGHDCQESGHFHQVQWEKS